MAYRRLAIAAGFAALSALLALSAARAGVVLSEPSTTAVAQSADDQKELAFWDSIKDSKDPAEYKAYLDTFPNGKFAALARARMSSLGGGQAPAAAPAATAAPAAPSPAAVVEIEAMSGSYVAIKDANVRNQPNARGAQVGSLPTGTQVQVTGKTKAGDWLRITRPGGDAYVSAPLLAAAGSPAALAASGKSAPAADSGGRAAIGKQYTTSRQAVVRQQPNADAPQVSTIPANAPVTVTGDVPGTDWYRVSYNGQDVGYVFGAQLTGVTTAGGGAAPAAAAGASPYGGSAGSTASGTPQLPGAAASSATTTAQTGITTGATTAAPVPDATQAQGEQKFEYWTASRQLVHIYPQPTSRTSFIPGEYYVDEQAIKVLEVIPGGRQTPWLKVLTPGGKIGYVFGGEAREASQPRSGRRFFAPEGTD